ncbi:MAG: hypothetical protein QM504_13410 [Pseudomonadota bacterium]
MFLVYSSLSFALAIYLARKTEQPFLGFLFLFWILAAPTITTQFKLYLPGIPFDLRINRIAFFTLLAFLSIALLKNYPINYRSKKFYFFEKVFFFYFCLVFLALIYNQNNIEFKTIFSVSWEYITFILVYLVSKHYIRQPVYDNLLKSIIIVAVISSIFAIIQFFLNNDFYRISPDQGRSAFGGILRSTGVFQNEYEQGYFLILGVFILLTKSQFKWKLILIGTLVLGVLLTFHRVDMAMLFLLFLLYFHWFRPKFFLLFLTGLFLIGSVIGTVYIVYEDQITNSSVVKERLGKDSGGREKQFASVLNKMADKPLGYGAYENKQYKELMVQIGSYISFINEEGQWDKSPLTVHNGYLAVGTKYGPLTMLFFIMFILNLLFQLKKMSQKKQPETLIPFIMVMIWLIANMTNGIEHLRTYFVLLMAIICGSYIGLYHSNLERLNQKNKSL